MRRLLLGLATLLGTFGISSAAYAATIQYTSTHLAGTSWRYDYTVSNNTLPGAIEQFTIFFRATHFQGLGSSSGPAGWDLIAIQPDPGIPADGYFDALASSVPGIPSGASVGGFSVIFSFLESGIPGSQSFDVVDPFTLMVLESGSTVEATSPSPAGSIPAPETAALIVFGLLIPPGLRRARTLQHRAIDRIRVRK